MRFHAWHLFVNLFISLLIYFKPNVYNNWLMWIRNIEKINICNILVFFNLAFYEYNHNMSVTWMRPKCKCAVPKCNLYCPHSCNATWNTNNITVKSIMSWFVTSWRDCCFLIASKIRHIDLTQKSWNYRHLRVIITRIKVITL